MQEAQHKIKALKGELEQFKKSNKKPVEEPSKGDRPYRIKILIDEHLSEMNRELCGMGDLSKKEVSDLLSSELQSIIDHIHKSIKAQLK